MPKNILLKNSFSLRGQRQGRLARASLHPRAKGEPLESLTAQTRVLSINALDAQTGEPNYEHTIKN